ncbi:ABC transporter permease [Salinactinospora qingdaonensis]|uniref:ABC transmembrane type-1 domain-containing protein n=1 Tax=Salinactinospora qingdaonensis TaxID=702744 RepID=A0ABP7FF04_9ACTN
MSSSLIPFEVNVPRIPVGQWFDDIITWMQINLAALFEVIGQVIEVSVNALSGLFIEPSPTQLTLIAAALVAIGLVSSKRAKPAGIAVGVWAVLALLELFTGAVATVITSLPAPLFLWAMNLFGADFVAPQLVLALLLIAALVAISFAMTSLRWQWYLAAGSSVGLLLFLVLNIIAAVQMPLLMMLLFAGLAYVVSGWRLGVFTLLGFLLIISMNSWQAAMSSLALILVATAIAVIISVPIGILAAYNDRVSRLIKPVLDFMQTLPPFVYLLPAIAFFGIGQVPGIIATIVFSMPPGVRLTELGIRQVDAELVEAGEAFGAPDLQILRRIQLPLALSTIMAGINQVIMLSLSMVVIAGMVGAGGLGNDVYTGIARADIEIGFEGGIAVVILAIFLDRLTGAITRFSPAARAQRAAST